MEGGKKGRADKKKEGMTEKEREREGESEREMRMTSLKMLVPLFSSSAMINFLAGRRERKNE